MKYERALPVWLAIAGAIAILIGIYQGLVHVAPGYEGAIMTGWGGELNHDERLLAGLGVAGVGGAVGSIWWKRLSFVPVAMGGVVLFYAGRAILHYVSDRPQLYTETTYRSSGEPVMYILGAEPFLLIAGGVLLGGAGIVRLRGQPTRDNGDETSPPSSPAT